MAFFCLPIGAPSSDRQLALIGAAVHAQKLPSTEMGLDWVKLQRDALPSIPARAVVSLWRCTAGKVPSPPCTQDVGKINPAEGLIILSPPPTHLT